MSTRYEHSAELGWKTDSEGGVPAMIFGYGLRMEDLPNDMPPHIRALVKKLNEAAPAVEELERYLEKAVNEYDYKEWDDPEAQ